MRTLKILSLLLNYPSADLQAEAENLKRALSEEGLLPARQLKSIHAFIDDMAASPLMDVQERYVHLFDRTRSLSLHLFEHVHGESRDRGQAMVDLLELYNKHGLDVAGRELPDFLPLFLEFLSTLPAAEAHEVLAEPLHIITVLKERLVKRESPYADIFAALEHIAGQKGDQAKVDAILEGEPDDDPDDMVAIDAAWEEKEVRFGPDAPGGECPKMQGMMDRMKTGEPNNAAGDK